MVEQVMGTELYELTRFKRGIHSALNRRHGVAGFFSKFGEAPGAGV
jgi:hypothetical protein